MPNRRRDPRERARGAWQPAGQHRTSSPDAGLSRGRARRSLGRLVVTPTFTAGACIVFAAVLAYGTTQTHLAFRRLGPPCARGQLLGRRPWPGRGLAAPQGRSGQAGRCTAQPATRDSRRRGPARPRVRTRANWRGDMSSVAASPGLPVVIAYRTVRRWHGGFVAIMTITNRSTSAIASWRLSSATGARGWIACGERAGIRHGPRVHRAGLVAPRPGRLVLRPGASAQFAFRASGHFGPPAGCFFDTARCRFHRSRG